MTSTATNLPLTTGWEADLDPADTVLRQSVLHFAEFYASAAEAAGGWALRRPGVCVADFGRPSGYFNSAIFLQPPAPTGWDGVLDNVEAAFAAGAGEAYLWSPWPTPDLRPRGWELVGHPPLLVRHSGGALPPAPPGLHIEEVRSAAGLEDWARVVVEGYPFAELLPYRPGCLFDDRILTDSRWRFWVGYDEERPVSIGTLFVSHGLAQLALGVSRPEARGRGFWYGLVRERLLAEPDLISGGVFSDDSRTGMERLGYLPITRFTLWQRARRA